MNSALFFRYCLFLLILVFTLLYALLPLWEQFREYPVKKISLLGGGLLLILAGLSWLGCSTGLSYRWCYLLGLLPLFGLFCLLLEETLIKKLYLFFNSTMIATNAIVYGVLLSAPMELNNPYPQVLLLLSALSCLGVALLLGLIYGKTLVIKIPYLLKSQALDLDWRFAVLIPAIITALFFWVIPRSPAVVLTGRVRITTMAFLTLGPLTFLLVYHAFWRIAVNLGETARLRAERDMMEMERKRYEELRSYMNETRDLRHDFRQHLVVMDEYAREGEHEKLSAYIREFTASYADHKGSFAANAAVDAVASHYDKMAEDIHCYVNWKIELPEQLPLKESDFITIFGNLTENALHGVESLPVGERSIQVTARMLSEAMLGLTVKNPYAGSIKLGKDGLPRSDKAGHGVGLSSVSAVVGRYNGVLDINTEGGVFTAGVLLYTT